MWLECGVHGGYESECEQKLEIDTSLQVRIL